MTKRQELTVEIPIGDWEQEDLDAEPKITGPDSLIGLRKAHGIGSVARMTAAARARKEAPLDIIKPDKLLYQSGIQADIAERIAGHMEAVQLGNGTEVNIRAYVATPPQDAEDEDNGDENEGLIVDAVSPDGLERAQRYLVRNVPGYVYGRLAIIAANKGNVREAAQGLVDAVWGMVERLEEPDLG